MNPKVYDDIRWERADQDKQWGGEAHDDTHGPWDWREYIEKQLLLARRGEGSQRERFVKIAALAIAAIESIDRRKVS